nr:MAG TPA: Frog antimicrobial peptide [Caudoviricetes sp.]
MKNLNGNPRSRALGGCRKRSYRPQSGLCSGEE